MINLLVRDNHDKVSKQPLSITPANKNHSSKISNNFSKPVPINQKQAPTNDQSLNTESNKHYPWSQPVQNHKNDQVLEPATYNVIQIYVAMLRVNQAKNEVPMELSRPKYCTKQGLPAVIFNKEYFLVKLCWKL